MSKYLFNKKLWGGVNIQIYIHDDVKDVFVYGFELCGTFFYVNKVQCHSVAGDAKEQEAYICWGFTE